MWVRIGACTSFRMTVFVVSLSRFLLVTASDATCVSSGRARFVLSLPRLLLATDAASCIAGLEVFLEVILRASLAG